AWLRDPGYPKVKDPDVFNYLNAEITYFFFSSRRRHTRFSRDWSSDVCSSDLACWVDQYAIGMLTTTVDSDLLSKDSWEKAEGPLFSMSIDNGVYGPGHNYFVTSKDGEEVWNVYHGNSNMGEGCGPRPTRLQVVNWDTNGVPDFGIPTNGPLSVPSGEYRFEAEHANNFQGEINEEAVTLSKTGDLFEIADINV